MNRVDSEEFHAKIMLFGEYSIICNSMGLTIPYDAYKGHLSFIESSDNHEFAETSNRHLKNFSKYIRHLADDGTLKCEFDLNAFEADIEQGLYFESNIPQGFGIGSSGALVAALYGKYVTNRVPRESNISNQQRSHLKDCLAQLESYFHGKSSGLDPLNCYLKNPLLIKNISEIDEIGLPEETDSKEGVFLIDTGTPGETGPLVKYFLDKCKQDSFIRKLKEEMIPTNDTCIRSFVKGEMQEFYKSIKLLSKFLLKYLSPMIPGTFIEIWKKGLETSSYYLKLCGSGGGGYLLGFAEDLDKAREELEKLDVKIIPIKASKKKVVS